MYVARFAGSAVPYLFRPFNSLPFRPFTCVPAPCHRMQVLHLSRRFKAIDGLAILVTQRQQELEDDERAARRTVAGTTE